MERKDIGMPFLLRYENVAWYERGQVSILDRRIYPQKVAFVTCTHHTQVAQAIADMVTQSAGPYTAVAMGMALAAYEIQGNSLEIQKDYLKTASHTLSHARPTTANRYGIITQRCAQVGIQALESGGDPMQAIRNVALESLNRRYTTMQTIGDHLADLIPNHGTLLTQCYGETIIGTVIRAARAKNKDFKVYCAETRPYLQGAKLTASCFAGEGFDTTVITDNMVAYTMERHGVDVFTSAADTIARDGHIANKIGTFQMAILANHFEIPYYVTGIPDSDKWTKKDIIIEQRDPNQVLSINGVRHTLEGVKAIYPSFDIVPPDLISGVVTDLGVLNADSLEDYFAQGEKSYY